MSQDLIERLRARIGKRQQITLGCVFNFKQVGGRTSDKGGHELDGQVFFERPRMTITKGVTA